MIKQIEPFPGGLLVNGPTQKLSDTSLASNDFELNPIVKQFSKIINAKDSLLFQLS